MKAKIVKTGAYTGMEFARLNQGDWFLDADGDVCIKTDEDGYNTVVASNGMTYESKPEDTVFSVQVTITY